MVAFNARTIVSGLFKTAARTWSIVAAMPTQRLRKLLADIRSLDEGRFELVQALRKLVLGLDPAITEEVKYGGILFSSGAPFCGVFAYAEHVSLEFGDGASLPDPHKVLEGAGKLRRHIKLNTLQDVSAKHVRDYLVRALQRGLAVRDRIRKLEA